MTNKHSYKIDKSLAFIMVTANFNANILLIKNGHSILGPTVISLRLKFRLSENKPGQF